MITDSFLENIEKYRIIDNSSNKFAQIYFDKIVADTKINLDNYDYVRYGYIYLSVKDANNFKLYYKDTLLFSISSDDNIIIPCAFEEDGYLKITGTCGNIKIFIYGAKQFSKNKLYLMPNSKYLVKDRGVLQILSYSTIDDIKNNNLLEVKSIDNCLDVQSFGSGNEKFLAYLKQENENLYLYKEVDNNTSRILIDSDVIDGVILYGLSLLIVYIKDTRLYYKIINQSDFSIGDLNQIELSNSYIPKSLSQMQYNTSSSDFIGVNFYDGSMQIYKFDGNKFDRILTKKADFSKLIRTDDGIEVLTMSDYNVSISKYLVGGTSLTQIGTPLNIFNVNDVLKIDDKYLLFANGECTETEYDTN